MCFLLNRFLPSYIYLQSLFIRYLAGSRVCHTHIYAPRLYPYNLIGPATIFWRPQPSKPVEVDVIVDKGRRGEPIRRTVWLQIHPSVYDECYAALRASASSILQHASTSGQEEDAIEIADLRGQLNIFEITGPKSSQVLKGALTLASTEGAESRDVRLIPFTSKRFACLTLHLYSFGRRYHTFKRRVLCLLVW